MAVSKFQGCYFYLLTPHYEQKFYVDNERSPSAPKTKYPTFSQYIVRLASFAHSPFHYDHRVLAQQGLFYKWTENIACCYECGFVLSHWRKDDSLLRHSHHSPECRHLATIADQAFLRYFKAHIQRPEANGSSDKEPGERETISPEHDRAKMTSPDYTSYSERLSTFKKFPPIFGLSINEMAAAGFYYKGLGDQVWCYACGNGLKKWELGEEPWEEHYKWIPDCPHLKQNNYKPRKTEEKPDKSNSNVNVM